MFTRLFNKLLFINITYRQRIRKSLNQSSVGDNEMCIGIDENTYTAL